MLYLSVGAKRLATQIDLGEIPALLQAIFVNESLPCFYQFHFSGLDLHKKPSSCYSVMHILCPVLLNGGLGLIDSVLPFVMII